MENKRCSVNQRINRQRTYQRTTEVVPSSVYWLAPPIRHRPENKVIQANKMKESVCSSAVEAYWHILERPHTVVNPGSPIE